MRALSGLGDCLGELPNVCVLNNRINCPGNGMRRALLERVWPLWATRSGPKTPKRSRGADPKSPDILHGFWSWSLWALTGAGSCVRCALTATQNNAKPAQYPLFFSEKSWLGLRFYKETDATPVLDFQKKCDKFRPGRTMTDSILKKSCEKVLRYFLAVRPGSIFSWLWGPVGVHRAVWRASGL